MNSLSQAALKAGGSSCSQKGADIKAEALQALTAGYSKDAS